jgi:hypothetical protein
MIVRPLGLVARVEEEAAGKPPVAEQVGDPRDVRGAGGADEPVDDVLGAVEQEFGQVGAILAADPGDQGAAWAAHGLGLPAA